MNDAARAYRHPASDPGSVSFPDSIDVDAPEGFGVPSALTPVRMAGGSQAAGKPMAKRTAPADPLVAPEQVIEAEPDTIDDFISGLSVRRTPEEVNAVQVFARRLVEDFDYPKSHITTRPQYRVSANPSGTNRKNKGKTYPVDIAVFKTAAKNDDELLIVVECKAPDIKTGRTQLELYLTMCGAEIGVWFNGSDKKGSSHLYLRKVYSPGGRIRFEDLPTLPRFGQRVEDIGRYLRRDLQVTEQLCFTRSRVTQCPTSENCGSTASPVSRGAWSAYRPSIRRWPPGTS